MSGAENMPEQTGAMPTQVEEKRKPWIVAKPDVAVTADYGAPGFTIIEEAGSFAVQIEADAWIRENIQPGMKLCSIRKGKMFEPIQKTQEADF
jgi:hypothetical protein